MITFEEHLLIESFSVGTKPSRSSKENMRKILNRYLSVKYPNPDAIADNILSSFKDYLIFSIEADSKEYILMLLLNNEGYYEMHFNRMDKVDDFSSINDFKNPIKVFSEMFRYAYWYVIDKNKKLMLTAGDKSRYEYYYRMVAMLKNRGMFANKTIKTKDLSVMVESLNEFDIFVENFV